MQAVGKVSHLFVLFSLVVYICFVRKQSQMAATTFVHVEFVIWLTSVNLSHHFLTSAVLVCYIMYVKTT